MIKLYQENKRKSTLVFGIFFINFLLLWLQFQNVSIYYDDYGYYSLSYGISNWQGSLPYTFTWGELFQFLYKHYFLANGRLLYFFLWLSLYKIGGLAFVQLGAAIITNASLYMIYKVINIKKKWIPIVLYLLF